ncbi:MAG: DUF3806 domain-containing protein [Thermoleophilia bacterium]
MTPDDATTPTGPRIAALSEAERAWVDGHLAALVADGIAPHDLAGLGALFDARLAEWSAAGDAARGDPNDLINRIGVGLGEHIRLRCGLRWVIATDEHGTDLAIHGEPGAILVFPAGMVAARWVAREAGALPPLAEAIVERVDQIR